MLSMDTANTFPAFAKKSNEQYQQQQHQNKQNNNNNKKERERNNRLFWNTINWKLLHFA